MDVGPNDWPMPIPLVENNGRWTFDTKAGAQTVVDRRIGRNELSAIRTLLACVDAQHDYFERARQTNGSGEYAVRLVSTPGHHDGLYWPASEGENESPLGPLVDAAQDAGYPGELVSGKPIPYEGYYFRILKAQGPNGDGGAKSYVQSGHMTGGFALIAWPAVFASSGIMTFIVGPDGDVYQKDLGSETAHIAAAMTTFDPDLTWSRVDDDERLTAPAARLVEVSAASHHDTVKMPAACCPAGMTIVYRPPLPLREGVRGRGPCQMAPHSITPTQSWGLRPNHDSWGGASRFSQQMQEDDARR